jgi:CarD family transcriptional regulator
VPVDAAERAGVRLVIPESFVQEVLAVLRDDATNMPKNWNRRFKHNREKIKTGDVFEVADVVRNLALREAERGLSTGEKQMFGRVKKILASELMYAKEIPEEEALEYLETILSEICEQVGCE